MSIHAQIIDGKVARTVDLDPAIRAGWVAAGNPKADAFLPVAETSPPAYDEATEALVEVWSIVAGVEAIRTYAVRPLTADELRKVWTTLDFLGRFTDAEMNSIEIGRENDEIVRSFYRAAMAAQEIVSDDPRTVAGMNYLVSVGILTQARRDEILG
jgi:hypothetical protein